MLPFTKLTVPINLNFLYIILNHIFTKWLHYIWPLKHMDRQLIRRGGSVFD